MDQYPSFVDSGLPGFPGSDLSGLLPAVRVEPREAVENRYDYEALRVRYDGSEAQLVDFGSRFGVWWSPDSPYFGIDHGGISSQREGKHFMAPLARLGVLDVASGKLLFVDPEVLARRETTGWAWGVVQAGECGTLVLRVTVAYAGLDVVVAKIEVENAGHGPRRVCLCLQAQAVTEDWNKSVTFHSPDRQIITRQTCRPPSRYQIGPERPLEVVTGWRTDFRIAGRQGADGGFCVQSDGFSLAPGERRVASVWVSTASNCEGSADRLTQLVRQRLAAQPRSADELIRAARLRWARVFQALPAEVLCRRWADARQVAHDEPLETLTPALVHRAMLILQRNTIRPQPEQDYGRVMGPHRGTFPSRFSYEGFWAWDSAFQALGLVEWDLELAKDNIRLMLRNQDAEGQLPMLHPDAQVPSAQPPLFTWVAMEIYAKDQAHDPVRAREFLEEIYPQLVRWNGWWFRCRDKNGSGLAEWGNNLESGWDDSPRWDNVDGHAGWNNDFGAARFEAADLNAYLIQDLRCLGRMAEVLQRMEESRVWAQRADQLAQLVVDVLYDPQDNLFYDTDYVTGEHHRLLTPASFLPLWAGVPLPADRVRRMIETYLLSREHFFGPYPFPTVAYRESVYDATGRSGYWRGPVWLNIAYFMIRILAAHGYADEARQASRRILRMVADAGICENYDSSTGRRSGNSRADFSWSAAMTIALATADLTHAPRPVLPDGPFTAPSVHVGVRLRDRQIYGRCKEAWVQLANRTSQALAGMLGWDLPAGWRLQIHDPWAGPEEGWIDIANGLAFQLAPGEHRERAVRFVLPDCGAHAAVEHCLGLRAVRAGAHPDPLGATTVRLFAAAISPQPGLTKQTAAAVRGLLHVGEPFRFWLGDQEVGQSAPGLVGLLNGRLPFLGRQSPAQHLGRRDFIRHAWHLLQHVPALPLRSQIEALLAGDLDPQAADEQARQLLETVVQQARDLTAA